MALGGPEEHCSGRVDPPSGSATMASSRVHTTEQRVQALGVPGDHLVIHSASRSGKRKKKLDSICSSGLSFSFLFFGGWAGSFVCFKNNVKSLGNSKELNEA